MLFIKIIFVIPLILKISGADVPVARPDATSAVSHTPAIPPAAPKCNVSNVDPKKAGFGLQFRLPFMDMIIENQRNLRIMQEPHKHQLFVLHGNELFQMFVGREEKRLSLIGALAGSVTEMEILGAEVISWHNYLLVVVAMEEELEIFQISETRIKERAAIAKDLQRTNEPVPNFEPIQQLTLQGKFQKLYLTDPEEDKVMMIVAVNFTKLYGKLRTYEWLNTYFDPIEELTVPPIHFLNVEGTQTKYLISGRTIKHQSKTILTIYEVKLPAMNLRSKQTLTVASRTVHSVTYRRHIYIIACSSHQKKCNSFRLIEGQFNVYKQRTSKELAFDKFVGGAHFLVGSHQNEITVYTNGRMDCFGSFTSNETEVSAILTHVNEHDENFILLNYKRPFYTLVRVIEVETESGEVLGVGMTNGTDSDDMGPLHDHRHMFEDTIGKLRSLLLKRKSAMDVFRKVTDVISSKFSTLKVKNPVHVQAGNIGIIKIVGKTLRSPMQLLNRIEDMGRRYRPKRFSRSFEMPQYLTFKMPMRLKVKTLRVENLIYDGSVLEGFYLDNLTSPLPILSVRPQISARVLHSQQFLTRQNYRHGRQLGINRLNTTLKSHQLNVERINNIAWNEFYDSVFLKNRDSKIQGRLIMQAPTKVGNLSTPLLNGLVVHELFNLKQPQVISSNIVISRFLVTDLIAEKVNDLEFEKDIVFSGRDNLVETPVIMNQISVAGDLLLADSSKIGRVSDMETPELQQFYMGKVILNGTLTLNNLFREDVKKTQVIVNGVNFSVDSLKQNYLLQNEQQAFRQPIMFGNAKVTAPQLTTNYLNDHPPNEYLRTAQQPALAKPLLIVFMSASVEGDVICSDYKSKILELHNNVVRHGDIANITGHKIFEAPLSIDHLMTLSLNHLPVNELILKSQLQQGFAFKGTKTFDNILVNDKAFIEVSLNSSYLNNLPLAELLNYDYHLDSIYLPHKLEASNIVFHKINGIPFDDVFTKFNIRNEQLILHKDLIIEGNVQFSENLIVNTINDIEWPAYEQSLVRFNENALIEGQKRFLSDLSVTKELKTPLVNNLKMEEIFSNILSKSKPQLITAEYSFNSLHLTNLDVSLINNMATAALIDMRAKEVVIEGDVIVPKITVQGSVKGHFENSFDFNSVQERVYQLTLRQWRNLVVLGNAYWNVSHMIDRTQYDQLLYLHKHAVRSTGHQVISGNVKLRRPLISKMITKTAFPQQVNFDYIAKDCLFKNTSAAQVVYGAKAFVKPLQMQNIKANLNLNAKVFNKMDILRLNSSLYRLSSGELIVGPMHFKTPPIINHLAVRGLVNGLKSEQIYHLSNSVVPPLKMHNLIIDNSLQIQDINDMSLDYLLENRVTKQGEALEVFGFLTFENLILNKEILLQSINGIPIDSLVFTKSKQLQAITGSKVILGDLILAGPAHVMNLNGKNLIDTYQQTVFTNRNYHFDNLVIDEATFESGLVWVNDFVASSQANGSTKTINEREKFMNIARDLKEIDNIIDNLESGGNGQKRHLLYLDYDFNTEILWSLPNETVDKSLTYEIEKRQSICERQLLQIFKSKLPKRIFLHNITTNLITANAYNFNIKAENYCKTRYRKVKSKITVSGKHLMKTFGMKKFIEHVEIYTPNENDIFVLLHVIDLVNPSRNEVRILKIDNNQTELNDWQSITLGIGQVMRLFQFNNHTVLVSSALIKNHPAVSIYTLSQAEQQFKLTQIIDGDYDIMEMVEAQRHMKYQLILSCRHCQRINIYEFTASERQVKPPYHIFQMLKLKTHIDKLWAFSLSDDSLYLMVLSENEQDYYHLYKYSHIQGWLHSTYGYFHNIKMALPLLTGNRLEESGDNLLLLLCGSDSDKCSLVKAFVQN